MRILLKYTISQTIPKNLATTHLLACPKFDLSLCTHFQFGSEVTELNTKLGSSRGITELYASLQQHV